MRLQRALAPHTLHDAASVYSLYDYPIHPQSAERSVTWEGSPATFVGWNVHYRGAYELETLGVIAALVRPDDTVIEVGANEGYHTIFAAWCAGPFGRVFAYEPSSVPLIRIIANRRRLGWDSRVLTSSSAVSSTTGRGPFFVPLPEHENQGVGGFEDNSTVSTRLISVDITTLDRDRSIDRCRLIKLDVQGAEPLVLEGALDLLRRCQPAVYFEMGASPGDAAARILEELEYDVACVRPSPHPPYFTLRKISPGWSGNCLAKPRNLQ